MKKKKKVTGYVPPPQVAAEAKKGLKLRKKFGRGATLVGMARGRQLATRKTVSPEVILRMSSYFKRHAVDKKSKNFGNDDKPSNGYVAWLLWGGDEGEKWADKVLKEIRKAEHNTR